VKLIDERADWKDLTLGDSGIGRIWIGSGFLLLTRTIESDWVDFPGTRLRTVRHPVDQYLSMKRLWGRLAASGWSGGLWRDARR